MAEQVQRTDAEWRQQLTPEQYRILREKGTERAFMGEYYRSKEPGVYRCAGCGTELFRSDEKYDSGTGWPSFWRPIAPANVAVSKDADGSRDEVTCARCDGHLGHVFEDGPRPTGLRFCVNSESLAFTPSAKLASLADPAADRPASPPATHPSSPSAGPATRPSGS